MKRKQGPSRRDFLKTCVAGGVALGAPLADARAQSATRATVVTAGDPLLRGDGSTVDPLRLSALLDRAMQAFSGTSDAIGGWKRLVQPGQVVGLKVNTIAGRGLSTNVALVDAVAARLQSAGIRANDIIIWDRRGRELERAGFRLSSAADGVRCMGTDAVGYDETEESFGVARCRLSKILTRLCDVVINVPLLKDHGESGMTLAMKNMYGVIDNPYECHANGCNPGVADVGMLPTIRQKVRFVVGDLTTACYEGGPMYRPQYAWAHNSLLLATDPVAADTIGWRIIERKRAEAGLGTLEAAGRPPRYIATAADARHRLGTDDPAMISLLEA
jgi:uncharacterized protein (DUF362 family)